MAKITQKDQVLLLLRSRGEYGVSAIELDRQYGIYRAAARIAELRAAGYRIETINASGKTAQYVLKPDTDLGNGMKQTGAFA